MLEHIAKARLLELADTGTRFTRPEFDHFKACNECLVAYAKSILQVARMNVRRKYKQPPAPRLKQYG